MSFPQVSVVKTGDKVTDKLSAGEEYCTMKKKSETLSHLGVHVNIYRGFINIQRY